MKMGKDSKPDISENPLYSAGLRPNLKKLQTYKKFKLEIASLLHTVVETFQVLGRETSENKCKELIVKLAEDRFVLAVLGQFKRGKSSLMNAIIGQNVLPTGVLPLTSAITILKYGPVQRLLINRIDSVFTEELPVSSLEEFVTEQGNPSNIKKIKNACVELPIPFLRYGIEFVDTPGIGSTISAYTATTYRFLPDCDAVLFITGADTPITKTELEFLNDIRRYVKKIFFIINKTDILTPIERDEVLTFVFNTVNNNSDDKIGKIFAVSALKGLKAKSKKDPDLYERSGLKALEETLASFLTEEKMTSFLGSIIHKTLQLIDEETKLGSFNEDSLLERKKNLQSLESLTILPDPFTHSNKLKEAYIRIKNLYDLLHQTPLSKTEKTNRKLNTIKQTPAMKTNTEFSLIHKASNINTDLQSGVCPVCRHITVYTHDYLAQFQYLLATEEQVRQQFAAEMGFCPFHTWQLFEVTSPLGASVGFAPLAEETSVRLHKIHKNMRYKKELNQLMNDVKNCRVCKMVMEEEEDYIRKLATNISNEELLSKYFDSQGVCLHHLSFFLDVVSSENACQVLFEKAFLQFEDDAEDMRSYALKQEALRRTLHNSNEESAYKRAIDRIYSHKKVGLT